MIYNVNESISNTNLNELASLYASTFGHSTDHLIKRMTEDDVFNADPRQYFDLKLLNTFPAELKPSDEMNWKEETTLGNPIEAAANANAVTAPTQQTFQVTNLNDVSTDIIIVYPNNQKGTIVAVNTATTQITVAPMNGETLPAVSIGDNFAHMVAVDKNRNDGFPVYYRADYVNKTNYIQTLAYAISFTKKEMHRYNRAGEINDYVARQRENVMKFMRSRVSNVLWNGEQGEVVLSDGSVEKTTAGLYPQMVSGGSPNFSTTPATIRAAFEDAVESSEFGEHGAVRFAFMAPNHKRVLSQAYKGTSTWYKPTDTAITQLTLDMIDIGSSKIVLVPYARFKDTNAFPASWADRIMIIDYSNVRRWALWGDTSGETLDREGGVAKSYKDTWAETQIGVRLNNPPACAWIDIV